MGWIDGELALTALAAMLSPTTLTFSVLVLVLSDRPFRTGLWFYLGALTATLGIGIVAAFVLGNAAASRTPSTPKTWVAVLDVVLALGLICFVVWVLRRPPNPKRTAGMIDQIQKVASSPIVAIAGAGAALANPGAFIPIALKDISELDPSATQYIVNWIFFTVVSLLPLAGGARAAARRPGLDEAHSGLGPGLARPQRAQRRGRDRRPASRSRCCGTGSPG